MIPRRERRSFKEAVSVMASRQTWEKHTEKRMASGGRARLGLGLPGPGTLLRSLDLSFKQMLCKGTPRMSLCFKKLSRCMVETGSEE